MSSSFIPDSELQLLFDPSIIPEHIIKSLPDDLHVRYAIPSVPHNLTNKFSVQIRPLASTDISRGHFSVLNVLSPSPTPSVEAYKDHFNLLRTVNASTSSINSTNPLVKAPTYLVLAIVSKANDQVVATGSLFIERKFLRGLSLVGHIEDIAVDKNVQGKRLGWRVVVALTELSESLGAYKTILNCSTDNIRKHSFKPDISCASPNLMLS